MGIHTLESIHKRIIKSKDIPWYVKILVLPLSWLNQGIVYMDRTERIFKIVTDFIICLAVFPILYAGLQNIGYSLLLSILIAHTLNWIFNSNISALLRNFNITKMTQESLQAYLGRVSQKAQNEKSILWAGVYGSLARGEFKETSDLDIRVIRKPGVINGIRACIFVMKERIWATLNRFPLDIYVGDSFEFLKKMSRKESPIVIRGKSNENNNIFRKHTPSNN